MNKPLSLFRSGYFFVRIPLWFGQVNVKHYRHALFSERNRLCPTLRIGKILFTWRTYR